MKKHELLPVLLLSLLGCERGSIEDRIPSSNQADHCAASLASASASRLFPFAGPDFVPGLFLGNEAVAALGGVSGIRWHAALGRYYVLDGVAHQVVVFDSAGMLAFRFGRKGGGPGEFALLNSSSRYSRNQVAFLGNDRVVVHDQEGVLHLFTLLGHYVDRFPASDRASDRHGWRHLDPWIDGGIMLDRTWQWRSRLGDGAPVERDPEFRGQLSLHTLSPVRRRSVGPEFARIRNHMSLVSSEVYQGPFDMHYSRLWGSNADGTLATLSLSQYGVCFYDNDLSTPIPYRIDAEAQRIGRSERLDYYAWREARLGPPPMGRISTWEDFYPFFPDEFPRHTDLVLAPDGTAWLERFVDMERRAWDLFHVERGYLGTIEPFSDRLPVAFTDRCAMVVEEVDPDRVNDASELFGIRLWCPAEAASG